MNQTVKITARANDALLHCPITSMTHTLLVLLVAKSRSWWPITFENFVILCHRLLCIRLTLLLVLKKAGWIPTIWLVIVAKYMYSRWNWDFKNVVFSWHRKRKDVKQSTSKLTKAILQATTEVRNLWDSYWKPSLNKGKISSIIQVCPLTLPSPHQQCC